MVGRREARIDLVGTDAVEAAVVKIAVLRGLEADSRG